MTLGTIIAIVLGIAVLVFLIFGFSTGWKNMWSKVTEFGAGADNVNTIKQACAIACSTDDEYGFCTKKRNTVLEDGKFNKTATCKDLVGFVEFAKGDDKTSVSIGVDSCFNLC